MSEISHTFAYFCMQLHFFDLMGLPTVPEETMPAGLWSAQYHDTRIWPTVAEKRGKELRVLAICCIAIINA